MIIKDNLFKPVLLDSSASSAKTQINKEKTKAATTEKEPLLFEQKTENTRSCVGSGTYAVAIDSTGNFAKKLITPKKEQAKLSSSDTSTVRELLDNAYDIKNKSKQEQTDLYNSAAHAVVAYNPWLGEKFGVEGDEITSISPDEILNTVAMEGEAGERTIKYPQWYMLTDGNNDYSTRLGVADSIELSPNTDKELILDALSEAKVAQQYSLDKGTIASKFAFWAVNREEANIMGNVEDEAILPDLSLNAITKKLASVDTEKEV